MSLPDGVVRVEPVDDEPRGLFAQYTPRGVPPSDLQPVAGSTGGSAIPATTATVTTAGSALDGNARPYATRGSAVPPTVGIRRPEVYTPAARHQAFKYLEAPTEDVSTADLSPQRRDRALSAGRPGHGAARRSSQRSGDSGSDDGPSSEPPKETPAELVARRFRELEAFVERHGLDYWDRHTDPPAFAQLELGATA